MKVLAEGVALAAVIFVMLCVMAWVAMALVDVNPPVRCGKLASVFVIAGSCG